MAGKGWSRMERIYCQGGWPAVDRLERRDVPEMWDALAAEAELAQAAVAEQPAEPLDRLPASAGSVRHGDRSLGPPSTEPRSLVLATPHGPPVALSPRDLSIEEAVAV
jgi:hypothetical protein